MTEDQRVRILAMTDDEWKMAAPEEIKGHARRLRALARDLYVGSCFTYNREPADMVQEAIAGAIAFERVIDDHVRVEALAHALPAETVR